MLWEESHRPKDLDSVLIHGELVAILRRMASENIPHLLFHGPSGSGKNTLINALIVHIFGKGALKVKSDEKTVETASKKTVEFRVLNSVYHSRFNPSVAGNNDKEVLQETLREIATTQTFNKKNGRSFKIVVIDEAERMSPNAQHSLRRTMEKYAENCRIILTCENANRLIEPLKSRCLCLKVPAPSETEISKVLEEVIQKEKIKVPEQLKKEIIYKSDRNLRRALLDLERCYMEKYPFTNEQKPVLLGWEEFIRQISLLILEQQSAKCLLATRAKLYQLLDRVVPAEVVMEKLAGFLLEQCDYSLQRKVIYWAAFHEERLRRGSKPIYHLEAFVARFMSLYKGWKDQLMQD